MQENYDLVDYINGLREAILETYVGIVGGLKAGGKANVLLPYINTIFSFLHLSLVDQERTDAILRLGVGLIGDLAEAFPNGQLKEALAATWISEALKAGRTRSGSHDTKKLAKWAKEVRALAEIPSFPVCSDYDLHRLDGPKSNLLICKLATSTTSSSGAVVTTCRLDTFELYYAVPHASCRVRHLVML